MYQLDSTHNLRTTADTLDQVHTILTDHLHGNRGNSSIKWLITGPGAAKAHGYINITSTDLQDGDDAIAESVQWSTATLIRTAQPSQH